MAQNWQRHAFIITIKQATEQVQNRGDMDYPICKLQSVSELLGQIVVFRQMLELGNTSIPRAPFSMLCSFAIKFDESGCFDLKLNIDRGGGREENIQTTIFTYWFVSVV